MMEESGLPGPDDFVRLESELFARVTTRHRRQVLRHRLVAAAAVLVVAGAGVAAGTIANPTQQSDLAYCYGGPSTSSQVAQALLPTNGIFQSKPGHRPSAALISRALSLCEGSWKSGFFDKTGGVGPFPVPTLQVCLRDDLIVSVFRKPNAKESADAFCNNLGLSAP
jgi:hypothetical protein